jgi:CRISPR-associated protein Cmr3
MTAYYFVRPTDSLFVRGNLAFGDSGEHGAGLMPPPPSLFAGAFRSAMLGRDPQALARFAQQGRAGSLDLDRALGTLDPDSGRVANEGRFCIIWLSLAGVTSAPSQRGGTPEAVLPLPADLLRLQSGFVPLTPGDVPTGGPLVADGRLLPRVAVLRSAKQEKPQGALYLRQSGWEKHIAGKDLEADPDAVPVASMHVRDPRLGIGLNGDSRTVETGLIYTTEGHAFTPSGSPFSETGFLVGIEGAEGLLPESGFLRLGGDGRGAHYRRVDWQPPEAPLEMIRQTGRFRLILLTAGLFSSALASRKEPGASPPGWLPTVLMREGNDYFLRAADCTARLVCAAVLRREIVSGWDLFRWKPKDALRAVPAGSVYWFEGFEGDPGKLASWVHNGLWGDNSEQQRRAEGYNLASLAAWM